MDPAILAYFGPPPDNVDLADSTQRVDSGVVIAMLCLAALAVALRFTARIILRNSLLADDWAIIVALTGIGGTSGLSVAGGSVGSGKHIWAAKLDDFKTLYKLLYSYTFVYAASCTCTRLSILYFYRRIFSPLEHSLKISIIFGAVVTVSYPILVWVTMGSACRPLSYFWNQFSGAPGECINIPQFFFATAVINMLNDFIILLLPFPRIIKLQMTLRKKIAICGILAVGFFVCIASIVRIYYLSLFMKTIDITWHMGTVFIWSTIEPAVAIVCACLPHFAPLAKLAHRSISSSFSSRKSTNVISTSHSRKSGQSHKGGSILGSRGRVPTFRPDRTEDDDEIGLTNYVTVGSNSNVNHGLGPGPGPGSATGSKDDTFETVSRITVQSSFVQASEARRVS
ncbi:uncharacterized protein BDV17DRAFT_280724 [Aspergillus undulatus]|uniref:uncharacterized protein n=1 Tax=Aspergillus undulatus TaxID=1810928 RepID=UPI003CCDA60A